MDIFSAKWGLGVEERVRGVGVSKCKGEEESGDRKPDGVQFLSLLVMRA
jgi:hypothetical protein